MKTDQPISMLPLNHVLPNLLLLLILSDPSLKSQPKPSANELQLKDTGKKIENSVNILISKTEYFYLQNSEGERISFKKPISIINKDTIAAKDIHTRGKTTLHMRRKSFSFDITSKATFYRGTQTENLKKFYAISLSMDKNYIRNRLAFELLHELHLFDLFYSFSELRINREVEGIYMIIERPQDWALKKKDSPLIIRRGFDHKIDKIKTGKKVDKPQAKFYKNYYTQIYRSLHKFEGKELYEVLSQWIDLEMYMKWLAFNFFVRNGDYTDEVYLCIDPTENRFKIIPWDYDDIFAVAPHEGMSQKNKSIGNKYIFSSEDQLDTKIADDAYLYEQYLSLLKQILQELSEEKLRAAFQHTYADLYPYYANDEIIGMSRFDTSKKVDVNSLTHHLNTIFQQLNMSRKALLATLE